MRSKVVLILSVFVIVVLFSGCTRAFSVKPFPIEPELVPKIQVKGPIKLINAQIRGTQTVFRSGMAITWIGDLSEWTDQAIDLLAYLLIMASQPAGILCLWGQGFTWAEIRTIWLWAIVAYKLGVVMMMFVVIWLTLWARQMAKNRIISCG